MTPPVLLVDDDLALAQALVAALESAGLTVEHCSTAEVAIELIGQKRYALALVDVVLDHGVSGIYVVNAIRTLPAARRPLILMITGASLENLRGVDQSLVAAVIVKPVDLTLFTGLVLAAYRRAIQKTEKAPPAQITPKAVPVSRTKSPDRNRTAATAATRAARSSRFPRR